MNGLEEQMACLCGCSPNLSVDGGGFCGEPCRVNHKSCLVTQEAEGINKSAMQCFAVSYVGPLYMVSIIVLVSSKSSS